MKTICKGRRSACSRFAPAFLLLVLCSVSELTIQALPAPDAIGGQSLILTATSGTSPFQAKSFRTLAFQDGGDACHQVILSSNAVASEATYTYAQTGNATGQIRWTSADGVELLATLTFKTATNGTYRLTEPGVSGSQSGTFQCFAGSSAIDPAGGIFDFTVTNIINSPFTTNSLFRINFGSDGTYVSTVAAGEANSSGTFETLRFNASDIEISLNDSGAGAVNGEMFFIRPQKGIFFFYGDSGYQMGIFEQATPYILEALSDVTAVAGNTVTFTAHAAGSPPLQYQWYHWGGPVLDATNSTLVLQDAQDLDQGDYYVEVSNDLGSISGNQFELSLLFPPTILVDPESVTAYVGTPAAFEVSATGNEPLHFQWRFNGADLKGQTNGILNLSNVHQTNAGSYVAIVTNPYGSATSAVATLDVPVVYQPLIVSTNGMGTITPDLNNHWFAIGDTLTLTAKPGPGQVFFNWSGTMTSTNPVLTFEMQSNMVVQANFVPNPFPSAQGHYSGLFFETNNVSHKTSGSFCLTSSSSGAFTGTVLFDGASSAFAGRFDLSGRAQIKVRRGLNYVTCVLQLDFTDGQITGNVSDGKWVAYLIADRAVFSKANPATLFAGKYTMAILRSSEAADIPVGDGYATLTVDALGTVRMTGSLADGVAISKSLPVSRDGNMPLYLSLYGGKGSLLGWIGFSNQPASVLGGSLSWSRPGIPSAKFYKAGFTNGVSAIGSSFKTPAKGGLLLEMTNGVIVFDSGNLSSPLINSLTLNTNNTISVAGTNKVKLAVNRANGLVQGSFLNPSTRVNTPVTGVILQNQNEARGYFRGTNQSGIVWLGNEL